MISLVQSFNLPHGIENSFLAKLQNAQKALNASLTKTMCNMLTAFINETSAQSGKALTTSQAEQMIGTAQNIKAVLGCP